MNFYEDELKALKKSNRYRKLQIYDTNIKDFATNDYLGLSSNKTLHKNASKTIENYEFNNAKASLLVGGYHEIHKNFTDDLCYLNDFEDGVVVGSGFCANVALIEALVRKNDILLMDEEYHASGILPTNLRYINKEFFKHNDTDDLQRLLLKYKDKKRKIIAIEGVYSMNGDLAKKEIFELAVKHNAILIVDEAHSSGVIGDNLLGIFDYYGIKIKPNFIKMGTLGKAYGSFGAYILSSSHIKEYLINRAKPLIYATALSLYDMALAHEALKYIQNNKNRLKEEIKKRQQIANKVLNADLNSLILPVVIGDNKKVIKIKDKLLKEGFFVGAIREPTVKKAILRIIPKIDQKCDDFEKLLKLIFFNKDVKII